MPSSRPADRIADMLANIAAIRSYTRSMDEAAFRADRRTRDAVERCLERVSEAARKLGGTAEALRPEQPWRAIRDLGNVLPHAYDEVDASRLWNLIQNDLPALEDACRDMAVRTEKS